MGSSSIGSVDVVQPVVSRSPGVDIVEGTINTASPEYLPSSPPIVKHDSVVPGPSERSQYLQATLSPEASRLPPPRTPASLRSRETTSDYYTAVWGSPYDVSPSQLSRSVRTAVSEQTASEDLNEQSPTFGLEHLIPSRLNDLSLFRPDLTPLAIQQETFDPLQTPRSRTQRWVQLPQREEQAERVHWWSDESAHSSDRERKRFRAASSAGSVGNRAVRKSARPGHKSRAANRTLDQESFWNTLREERSDDMSSLFESRWAATPEPMSHPPPPEPVELEPKSEGIQSSRWADTPEPSVEEQVESKVEEKPKEGIMTSRWADTPEPEEADESVNDSKSENKPADGVMASRWADTPEPEETPEAVIKASQGQESPDETTAEASRDNDHAQAEKEENQNEDVEQLSEVKVVEPESQADETVRQPDATASITDTAPAPSPNLMRLEPPRLRKRVSWKGKNIVISIPRFNFEASGMLMPMSKAEIDERMKRFEDNGYDTRGFDLSQEENDIYVPAQVRAIFPPESETKLAHTESQPKVLLPDLEKWKAYTNWLTEQKLAALGVTLGGDEPPPAQAQVQAQDMSRQSSGQYPPLPFSPPIPTTSANSMNSMGRPGMVRGHSHTMSVATPASPLNGPFGHMHRHSTLTGLGGLPQLQQTQQSPGIPGLQPFSPQQQFAFGGLPRGGSPAQLAALRQDLGVMRGPGSPLNLQLMPQASQEYSRGLVDDQRRRQHSYSQSMAQPIVPNAFVSQASSIRPTPALPELPEDEDEEELDDSEPPAYVPPHKRAQANAEIAVPTPRGHRHNISEGLERELLEAEQRQKAVSRDWIEVTEEEERPSFGSLSKSNGVKHAPPKAIEKDPLGAEHPVQETAHARKKSGPRFNVAAPAFTFNPTANFQPRAAFNPSASFVPPQSSFTFGNSVPFSGPAVTANPPPTANHNRNQSSGTFNVAAPAFKPATSEFSFSSSGPSFGTSQKATKSAEKDDDSDDKPAAKTIVDELPSIFGKIDIPDIVKPARRSKAIAIIRPDEVKSGPSTDFEDDEGRVAQGDAKRKQQRKLGDDGDSVPLFAEPSGSDIPPPPPEKVLGSNDQSSLPALEEAEIGADDTPDVVPENVDETAKTMPQPAHDKGGQAGPGASRPQHGHKHSSSLSALAKSFQPFSFVANNDGVKPKGHDHYQSISELEEGELREAEPLDASPLRAPEFPAKASALAPTFGRPQIKSEYSSNERIDNVAQPEPSFDEIDAVMRQLNADESEREPEKLPSPVRLPSPGAHPMKGVTYLPEQPNWPRSDAPSPSPRRQQLESSFNTHDRTDSGDQTLNGWPQVRQLNKADDAQISDWSGILSPPDEEKLQQRSHFFDSHIDKLIGRVVEQRLQPLEESLRSIHNTVSKRNRSSDLKLQRSSSNVESDADDEDELSDERKHRPVSRGRDKRVDQIKAVVLEALREQSPKQPQAPLDLAELHSVLADMKVSFARAASASLELDDIRAVVEDSLTRQSQAVVPVGAEDHKVAHKRELSELEGRLNETLAGALEEANQRRAIEEREAEARRQLRLAEEELQLLRDTARDDESKIRAMEKEREDMIDRLDRAEDAHRTAEEKFEDAEAEKDALQATLEEYRTSSNKWRHDLDEAKRVRENLEKTISSAEQQNVEYQESTMGMKRRLEKLHSDMATAAGQLASEKATWKAREEDYRTRIEALEAQRKMANRERNQLEDELRIARATAIEAAESRNSVEHLRATNGSLEEMVRKLQGDLVEQQTLASRYERQFHDAQESGRAEVHRTRMSLETEVEAANHQVNLVRAELDTELARVRTEFENLRIEAETARDRHERLLEEEEASRREALRKVNHSSSIALDEARQKYENAIQQLTSEKGRALSHALEDKQRTEQYLHEQLTLSDAKLQHYQERVAHLEERLEIAKSAAQAAAINATASKALVPASAASSIPEKISPQALRESILVLQEQLQERESRIERLQAQVEEEGPAKLKERDTEINWLRELLAVRSEELTDLVATLAQPNFDRAAVRDTAIRIRANLQMEQQEKERFGHGQQTLGGQALASLSNFASPRAASLTSAFNKWRANMESGALKNQRPGVARRSYTSSRLQSKPPGPGYSSGLMTPPASNLRSSPVPDDAVLAPPKLQSRSNSKSTGVSLAQSSQSRSRNSSNVSEGPSTPLFREQSYDRDADDTGVAMQNFEDDDLDVADSEPPAFRSLESELEPTTAREEEQAEEEEEVEE